MSEVKCCREACSWSLEDSVTRGMHKKCVSGGFGGGMAGRVGPVCKCRKMRRDGGVVMVGVDVRWLLVVIVRTC